MCYHAVLYYFRYTLILVEIKCIQSMLLDMTESNSLLLFYVINLDLKYFLQKRSLKQQDANENIQSYIVCDVGSVMVQ